jgi:RNA polymerase sigma-B factor
MQATSAPSAQTIELLTRQAAQNRARLVTTCDRMVTARSVSEAVYCRTCELRSEARRKLDQLSESLAVARRLRRVVVSQPAPVLPRYVPARPDPVDVVRRQLHEAYAASHDPALRAELMSSYDGFARSLALKFRHRESLDDLVQVARIGLLHAIDRFDPALGRPFPLFARITITGELKRHLRDKTWSMRVPRSLQEDYLRVMRAVDELTAEQSSSPSMEAVAARCEMPLERVIEAMELRFSQRPLSIDQPATLTPDDPVIELGIEDLGFRQLENRQLLEHLLGRLPERDRRIIELRFVGELTQSEIADEIGVSQMCVSRVLSRTLGRLRLWARNAVN